MVKHTVSGLKAPKENGTGKGQCTAATAHGKHMNN